jgi:hypothetical protein
MGSVRLINVTFDQYQRYNNVRKIVEGMRTNGQVFRILEVGANEHQNLERFLPQDEITYLDIHLPDHLLNNPKYRLGDATAMDFADDYYDVIVALDVFEHIPPDRREAFINELYRVSANFFIITAPFENSEVVEAEVRVNSVYRSFFMADFIWLEEHMRNGLPKLDELENYLSSRSMNYSIWGHGNIRLWERLLTLHFVAAKNPLLATYRSEIDRYYNRHLFDLDYGVNTYRKIVTVVKKGELPSPNYPVQAPGPSEEELEQLQRLEDTFYRMAGLIQAQGRGDEDSIQVFMDTGKGFNEQESRIFQKEGDWKWSLVSLKDLPAEPLISLRIDPSRYKGTYGIRNLSIISRRGETIQISEQLQGNYYTPLNEDTYYFHQDDPFIIVNLKDPQDIHEIRFEVFKLDEKETLVSVLSHSKKELSRLNDKHQHETERLALNIQSLKDELAESRKSLETLIGSKSWRLMVNLKRLIGK